MPWRTVSTTTAASGRAPISSFWGAVIARRSVHLGNTSSGGRFTESFTSNQVALEIIHDVGAQTFLKGKKVCTCSDANFSRKSGGVPEKHQLVRISLCV